MVEHVLRPKLKSSGIQRMLDGAVLYHSDISLEGVAGLRFFQNSFLVIKSFENLGRSPITRMMRAFDRRILSAALLSSQLVRRAKSFRIVTSSENRLSVPDKRARAAVESVICKALHVPVSRAAADLEIWFLYRREGVGFILLRLTRRRATEKTLNRGELKPEMGNLLCSISEPSPDDVFLDPFCGFGAIVMERAVSFPARKIYGIDSSREKINQLRNKIRKIHLRAVNKISLQVGDSRNLSGVPENSVSKIVTDPPWGDFNYSADSIIDLYRGFITALPRIMIPGGIAVLLVGRDGPTVELISANPLNLRLDTSYRVLISGKKALVCKILIEG